MSRHLRSIRGRITLIATALVAATLLVASVVLMQWVQADLLASAADSLDQALQEQAEQFGLTPELVGEEPVLEEALAEQDFAAIEGYVDGSEIFIGLFTGQGDGLAYGEMFVDGAPAAGLVVDVESGHIVDIYDIGFEEQLEDPELAESIESLAFDVIELASGDGERFLVGAAPLDEVEQSVAAIRQALMFIVPSLVAVFAMLTWWLTGRALRPVRSITDQVEAISTSSLDRRVPVPETGDEVAELATVMNRMLDRLERGGDRQRQFSADASHELRSPLSTVRAAAELLGADPPKARAELLVADIVAESDRMDELISDLLELSRLDEDRRSSLMEEVNVVDLLERELGPELSAAASPAAGRAKVELVSPPMVSMTGSPRQLQRLVRNLVDNARRHAAERVLVEVAGDPEQVCITVDDDGAGVAKEAKQTIFERFSRLDEARSRDGGGAGLGLALVKAIASNHNGIAWVEDSSLGGARFVVMLPTHRAEVPITPSSV